MPSLRFTVAKDDADIISIKELQKKNLQRNLSPEETARQGFVTVEHSLDDLRKLNAIEKHIICKDGDEVIAYLLAMTVESKEDIPVLIPMFRTFEDLQYKDKLISTYNYIVVGQVCVDKDYRGKGILDQCYNTYKNSYCTKYDFAVTEIATRNIRSIRAHCRVGFTVIHTYVSPDGEEWAIVVWDW
ncbi:GNAT family N-acetyltransferase [Pollutibacter soli]|uniref:GNAT family N-acetyltransferase n=1 Tax=Pollutibacter soli TaxID=3034157 RepID=UPI0030132D9C